MAEQDFNINIRTTADTTGVKQTEAELQRLSTQVGSLTGALIGGVGVSTIANLLKQYGDEINKTTAEIDKQAARVVELGNKWEEAAKSALTAEDVRNVASAGMSEFDNIHKRITQIATEDVPLMHDVGDTFVKALKNAFTLGGDPNAKGPYEVLREELIKSLALDEELLKKQKIHAIELGETYQDRFDQLKEEPIDEAVGKVGEKVNELETKQRNLNKASADYLKDYNEINRELILAERTINLLLQHERQRKAEAAATAQSKQEDVDFWTDQVKRANPAELANLRRMADSGRPIGGRMAQTGESQELVNQIERNRINAERGAAGLKDPVGNEVNQALVDALNRNTEATNANNRLWQ